MPKLFAVTPFEVICRFVELSKTEIIILSYYYGRRNKRTGQCNPRLSQTSKDLGIDKSHVSVARRGLASKGWIVIENDGNILLEMPMLSGRPTLPFQPKRRTNKGAESAPVNTRLNGAESAPFTAFETGAELAPEQVRNPQQPENESGAHLAPDRCGISTKVVRNAHLPDLNRERTDKKQIEEGEASEALAPPQKNFTFELSVFEHPAVIVYQEKFQVNIRKNFAQEIVDRVKPETMQIWIELISDKIAYADMDLKKRQGIATWILTAFKERIEEKNGKSKPKSEREKSTERGTNARNMVAELRRIGESEREQRVLDELPGGSDGDDHRIDIAR